MNEIYVHKDENNAIVLYRDSFKAISVQLIRFTSQQVPNAEGILVAQRRSIGLWRQDVPLVSEKGTKIKPEIFRQKVAETISKARIEMAKIKKNDDVIEGVLNDYHSQNKGINHGQQNKPEGTV